MSARFGLKFLVAVGLVVVIASAILPTRAWAQVSGQASGQASGQVAARDDYEAILEESLAVRDRYEAAVERTRELEAEIAALDVRSVELQAELAGAQARVDEADASLMTAEAELASLERRLARETQRLRDESVAAYMGAGKPVPDLGAAMRDPKALDEFARVQVYADVVVADRKNIIAEVTSLRASADELRGQAQDARDTLASNRDDLAARKADLDSTRADRQRADEQAKAAAEHEQQMAVKLEDRRREAELRYADEILDSDSIGMILAQRQRGQKAPASTLGIFLNPIKNGKVVSPYGARIDPFLGVTKVHAGLDIDAVMGEPVRASEAGTVVIASEQGGYGLAVVIDHGNTLATLCGHMSAFTVKPGDVVTRGQVVGYAGSTGRSTGPHCHWEVRVMGTRVEGTPYLSTVPER